MTLEQDPATASLLVVEDSRIQARVLSDKLTQAGYQVRTAENGRIGLHMIRENRPTLVISDIEMPEMTGYELCHAVKNDSDLRTIPFYTAVYVVRCSGHHQGIALWCRQLRHQALRSGISDWAGRFVAGNSAGH